MADGVGVVIPAFRPDPERLERYLESLQCTFDTARLHVELDRPTRAVMAALEGGPASVRISGERRGKGAAITAGFDYLDTPILAFVDADGSTPATSLERVLEPVRAGRAELAVGSRRHPDAHVVAHQTLVRRHLGDVFPRLARLFLPVALYDYQCGAKAIDRETWRTIREELVSPRFAWDLELVAIVADGGGRVEEVPIIWEDHPGTTVPVLGTTSDFARTLLRSYHRTQCRKGNRLHRWFDRVLGTKTPLIARTELEGVDETVEPA